MTTVDVSATAGLAAVLGRIADKLDRDDQLEAEMARAFRSVPFPAVQFTVTSNVIQIPTAAAVLLGPEIGQVWDVRRITLAGLGANDQVGIYRQASPGVAQPENLLDVVSQASPSWAPGGGLFLHDPDSITLAAYSATLTATLITLNWEGAAIDARLEWKYIS